MKEIKAVQLFTYIGSKRRILNQIFSVFPTEMHDYHETFLGGCSVLIELLNRCERGEIRVRNQIFGSDVNPHLINVYNCVKYHSTEMCIMLKDLFNQYNSLETQEEQKAFFHEMRTEYNKSDLFEGSPNPITASLFVFLTRTSWMGIIKYSKQPWVFDGTFGYKNKVNFDFFNLSKLSYLFNKYRVEFYRMGYEQACELISHPESFWYCDPPYVKVKLSTFNEYAGDFCEEDSIILFEKLKGSGCKFAMSNFACDLVEEYFGGLNKYVFDIKHRMSKKPKQVQEIVVYN